MDLRGAKLLSIEIVGLYPILDVLPHGSLLSTGEGDFIIQESSKEILKIVFCHIQLFLRNGGSPVSQDSKTNHLLRYSQYWLSSFAS
jgi:hypothetical protein